MYIWRTPFLQTDKELADSEVKPHKWVGMNTEQSMDADVDPAIEFLAEESHVSIDEVVQVYRNELVKLEVGARVKDFIPVLAYRRVRQLLRQRDIR